MSISPSSHNHGSNSSSCSSAPSHSSSPNHGFINSSHQHKLPLSDSSPSRNIPGRVASGAGNSDGSSEEVNGRGRGNHGKNPVHHNGGQTLHTDALATAPIGSPESQVKSSPTSIVPSSSHESASSSSSHRSNGPPFGKKSQMVSGNHLLNFHYNPIPVSRGQTRAPPPRRQHKRIPYNKDLFFQANYKFVVLDTGNYALESMDPDKMLNWDDIICLKYSSPFSVQCPICLDDPLCPQITSCGHIFCFPCILQYFSIGEDDLKSESWKKCPLCFTMISSKDLYTIQIETVKQYHVGDTINFILLTRQKDSFCSSFKDNERVTIDGEILDSFSKFTLTSDVELSVREAMSDLDSWIAKADSGLVDDIGQLPYVCAAMEQLERRKKYWNEHRISHRSKDNSTADKVVGEFCSPKVADYKKLSEDHEGSPSSSHNDNKNSQTLLNGVKDITICDSYNFYQSIDGQHLIIHPLNMKCLLHHYGSYERLPNRITGKILQLETVTQSDAMRRRYRFLSHFSLTTTFQLCEIDLSDILPAESLSPFTEEIKSREKQRKRLAKKEQEDKIKAEIASSQFVHMPYYSNDGSPSFSMDDFEALGSSGATTSSPPTVGERQLFSSVARLGFAAAHDSPSLKTDENPTPQKIDLPRDSSSSSTGLRNAGSLSFANVTSRAKPVEGPKVNEVVKKGKKQSRVLMSTAGGRRY